MEQTDTPVLLNVTNYTRVISVIAAVSRQVERDGQTFWPAARLRR